MRLGRKVRGWLGPAGRIILLLFGTACLTAGSVSGRTQTQAGEISVFLWFDTEDYLLSEADEALLRLAEFLQGQGVRATFKLVGEKARVLERRGREDALRALQFHSIGYHTDFHSVHPTPAMYLARLGWFEGVEEFDRRERAGFEDVSRITGRKPACYGQPGSSWAPQVYGALRRWGVPVYLDASEHIDVDGRPFWYAGVLCLQSLTHTFRTELGGVEDLEAAKERFTAAYNSLLEEGGGVISIYYHPCEFVHREFWDAVNFARGANPPPERWQPPSAKTREEIETGFQVFEEYIRFIASHREIRFRTADEAPALFADRALGAMFSSSTIKRLAELPASGVVDFQEFDGFSFSPAEQFVLLAQYLAQGGEASAVRLPVEPVLGPVIPQPLHEEVAVEWRQVERTLADAIAFVERHGRVPDEVWLGSRAISPESFLTTVASLVLREDRPSEVVFRPVTLRSAKRVRNDSGLWSWVIFPSGFDAPEMMRLAARQSWSLKPALRADSDSD
ncbi:MAG TPA: hypothetical protein P5568_07500 [Acidobacteriota bacterium]|nr:hypothetical protein [Acidobacteriota bacterium]